MSLTQEEREGWGCEINRLNAEGWAEHKRQRTEAIKAANPGMSFEHAWSKMEREERHPAPEPTCIGEAAKLVNAENPTWTFEESWRHAEAVYPDLTPASSIRVAASTKTAPHLEQREKWKDQARVEAAARELMAESRGRMTFGDALERARSATALTQTTYSHAAPAIEPERRPRMLLIRGSEGTYID